MEVKAIKFEEFPVANHANIFFTTGSLDAIKASEDDRRWFELKHDKKEIRLNPDFDFETFINNKNVKVEIKE